MLVAQKVLVRMPNITIRNIAISRLQSTNTIVPTSAEKMSVQK